MKTVDNVLPTISVIMPTYNSSGTIRVAIESVIGQNYPNLEFIIIDGGSQDGTLEIIQSYQKDITHWIAEPDKGIYDAMNKGIDRATGDWLYFMGADDQINPEILLKVAPHLHPTLAAVYGDVIYDTGDVMHSRIGFGTLIQNTLHHQATFYNKNLFVTFRYNVQYRVISDYELNLQLYLQKKAVLFIPYVVATCGSTGTSSTLSTVEVNHLRGKYITNKFINYLLNSYLQFYYFYFKSKKSAKTYLYQLRSKF